MASAVDGKCLITLQYSKLLTVEKCKRHRHLAVNLDN